MEPRFCLGQDAAGWPVALCLASLDGCRRANTDFAVEPAIQWQDDSGRRKIFKGLFDRADRVRFLPRLEIGFVHDRFDPLHYPTRNLPDEPQFSTFSLCASGPRSFYGFGRARLCCGLSPAVPRFCGGSSRASTRSRLSQNCKQSTRSI